MADAKLIKAVKAARGITGDFEAQDVQIGIEIDEVIAFMISGGVPKDVANSEASAGVIARGIEDIKYNGGKLSDYFYQRVSQLAYTNSEEVAANES